MTLMATAQVWASRSTCSRLAVGAVAAVNGRGIAQGYNGAPRGIQHCLHGPDELPDRSCTIAKHAEENLVANAAYHGTSTQGATVYVTHSPCLGCAGLLINAGIYELHYAQEYRGFAGVNLLKQAGIDVWRLPL